MTYQAMVNNLVPGGLTIQNCAAANYTGGAVSSCVSPQTTGQYTVKIDIYNEAGELVAALPVSQYSQAINGFNLGSGAITSVSGPGSSMTVYFAGVPIGTWNGTDGSGNPVANGAVLREGGQHQQHGGGHERDRPGDREPLGVQGGGEDLQRGGGSGEDLVCLLEQPGAGELEAVAIVGVGV